MVEGGLGHWLCDHAKGGMANFKVSSVVVVKSDRQNGRLRLRGLDTALLSLGRVVNFMRVHAVMLVDFGEVIPLVLALSRLRDTLGLLPSAAACHHF